MTASTTTERLMKFAPLFKACKDDTERRLLCTTIREGTSFTEFTAGFQAPYNVTDLIMVSVAKTMRLPQSKA